MTTTENDPRLCIDPAPNLGTTATGLTARPATGHVRLGRLPARCTRPLSWGPA